MMHLDVTMYGLLSSWPMDVRVLIAEFSDPTTDRVMWPEYRHLFEDWGWFGSNDSSCVICGLLTCYWPYDDDAVYLIASYSCHLDDLWHFQTVCSARCEHWDDILVDQQCSLEIVE